MSAPDENLSVYTLLFDIEVALRELIIDRLEAHDGPAWWKRRLPPDILDTVRKAREYQTSVSWVQAVDHHPLYYIDFPDLRKIIDRNDNWRDVFRGLFTRKEVFLSSLSEVEPIRNAVAHNRRVSRTDLSIVVAAQEKVSAAVGPALFDELVTRSTSRPDIRDVLGFLQNEAIEVLPRCIKCESIALQTWPTVRGSWWFDVDYLARDVNDINTFFTLMETYQAFPRHRGEGFKLEAWVKSNDIHLHADKAIKQLEAFR